MAQNNRNPSLAFVGYMQDQEVKDFQETMASFGQQRIVKYKSVGTHRFIDNFTLHVLDSCMHNSHLVRVI